MENDRAVIGALLLIVLVVGANFILYGVVRGLARIKNMGLFEILGKSLNAPAQNQNDSMNELHRRVQELEEGRQGNSGDSEQG